MQVHTLQCTLNLSVTQQGWFEAEWLSYRFKSFSSPLPVIRALVSAIDPCPRTEAAAMIDLTGNVLKIISQPYLPEQSTAESTFTPLITGVCQKITQDHLIHILSDVASTLKWVITAPLPSPTPLLFPAAACGHSRDETSSDFLAYQFGMMCNGRHDPLCGQTRGYCFEARSHQWGV